MSKEIINKYNITKSNILMNFKFIDIQLGNIKYTKDDIDELIEFYTKKEEYILLDKLNKLKQR